MAKKSDTVGESYDKEIAEIRNSYKGRFDWPTEIYHLRKSLCSANQALYHEREVGRVLRDENEQLRKQLQRGKEHGGTKIRD